LAGSSRSIYRISSNYELIIHWQVAGSLAAAAGLTAIMASKIAKGKDLFAVPSLHAAIGFITLIGVFVQV
jgi:cytochrome b561